MNHVDLVVAIAGVLVTIAAIVLGAWLDLRSGPGGGESRAEPRGAGLCADHRAESRDVRVRADRRA
jgi:hypothetical protein